MFTITYCDCVSDNSELKERMTFLCKMLSEQFTQAAQFDITDEVIGRGDDPAGRRVGQSF